MVASGNDFIVIDNRSRGLIDYGHSIKEAAKRLCGRRLSVGADGMLLIENSKKADFKMRIFNPDGSEVDMCGNGSRCVALYAVENGIAEKDMKIETSAGVLDAEVVGLRVKVRLTDPESVRLNKRVRIGKKNYKIHFINTGVPHAVSFVEDPDRIDVEKIGSKIRFHRSFKPKGTNADFVKVLSPKELKLRTYERGVEAETLACGTGAAASAIVSSMVYGFKPHIDVNTKSGEVLRVYFDIRGKGVRNVFLEGEAKAVYKGRISYV
ncbi:MAG: diaminopimelate epimerase [Candidatus Omnitrophica bacterium]|nr:diaminopimelate epimerase [Candidatus Omnitrophota bacterium]